MLAARSIAVVIGVLATLGCGARPEVVAGTAVQATQWQHASAGFVGCRAADITISEYGDDNCTRSWIATCHGRDYVCSLVWDANAACTALVEAGVAAPALYPAREDRVRQARAARLA